MTKSFKMNTYFNTYLFSLLRFFLISPLWLLLWVLWQVPSAEVWGSTLWQAHLMAHHPNYHHPLILCKKYLDDTIDYKNSDFLLHGQKVTFLFCINRFFCRHTDRLLHSFGCHFGNLNERLIVRAFICIQTCWLYAETFLGDSFKTQIRKHLKHI